MNRREMMGGLSALALLAKLTDAQTDSATSPSPIRVFKADEMKSNHSASGSGGWGIPAGLLPPGDIMEVRSSTLDAGKDFSPMRLFPNAFLRFVQAGRMEVLMDGMPTLTATAGDILFTAPNLTYQLRNPGDAFLAYFVIQIKHKQDSPAS
jgi:hypothetical protein